MSVLGDLDGNGALDLAVGAVGAHGEDRAGALYVVLLQARAQTGGADVAALALVKASAGVPLGRFDLLGSSAVAVGDVDGDGVADVAVGAPGCDGSAGRQTGAVFLLFLRPDGTRKAQYVKFANESGAGGLALERYGQFGAAVAPLHFDGGVATELAVGAPGSGGGGAVHVLTLGPGGKLLGSRRLCRLTTTVVASALHSPSRPPARANSSLARRRARRAGRRASRRGGRRALRQHIQPRLGPRDAVRCLRHRVRRRDGDAIPELVVGAPSECCGGALYVVLHARDAHVRLEGSELGLPSNARFGWSLAVLQDGGPVVAVGATGLDDSAGGVQLVRLNHTRWSAALASPSPSSRMPVLSPRPALPGAPPPVGATAPRPPSPVAVAAIAPGGRSHGLREDAVSPPHPFLSAPAVAVYVIVGLGILAAGYFSQSPSRRLRTARTWAPDLLVRLTLPRLELRGGAGKAIGGGGTQSEHRYRHNYY